MEEKTCFQGMWKRSIDAMLRASLESGEELAWSAIKCAEHDAMQAGLVEGFLDEFMETMQTLTEAAAQASPAKKSDKESDDFAQQERECALDESNINRVSTVESRGAWQPAGNVARIKMTKEVVKWL